MISAISDYFDARVKEIDPDLDRWDEDVTGERETTENIADSYYKLWFGTTAHSRDGNGYVDEIPVFLEIYSSRSNDFVGGFNSVYDKALSIKDNCIAPCNAKNDPDFTDVFAISTLPAELDTNDNTIQVTIEFNVRRDNCFPL